MVLRSAGINDVVTLRSGWLVNAVVLAGLLFGLGCGRNAPPDVRSTVARTPTPVADLIASTAAGLAVITPYPTAPSASAPTPSPVSAVRPVPTPVIVSKITPTPRPRLASVPTRRDVSRFRVFSPGGAGAYADGDDSPSLEEVLNKGLYAAGITPSHLVFDYRTTIASVDIEATRLQTIADTAVPPVFPEVSDVDANLGFDVGKRPSGPMMGVYAAVSPDGSRIAYWTCEFSTGQPKRDPKTGELYDRARLNTYKPEIAIVGFDGSDALRVTENAVADYFPEWSPDGIRLAYGVLVPRGARYDSYTGRPTNFIRTPGRYDLWRVGEASDRTWVVFAPPIWSPDGERIAFVAVEESGRKFHKAIFTVRPDGTDLHRVFRTDSIPSWSPDGQRLAFVVRTPLGYSLSTIRFDGTDLATVALLPERDGPWDEYLWKGHDKRWGMIRVEWSPTGEHIAVAPGGDASASST